MIFVCALIIVANVSVSLSFGGGTSPFVLLETLILLPVFAKIPTSRVLRYISVPLLAASPIARFCALFVLSKGVLGDFGSIILVIMCISLCGIAAYKRNCAVYSAVPIFFITVLLALYVVCVSFAQPLREPFDAPHPIECIAAAVCPFSSCAAVSKLFSCTAEKAYIGAVSGVAVSSVFLIFQSAGAEFGFISVMLSLSVSALEIKACCDVISDRQIE